MVTSGYSMSEGGTSFFFSKNEAKNQANFHHRIQQQNKLKEEIDNVDEPKKHA